MHPFLVERVDIPDQALEGHLGFVVGQKRAQGSGGEPVGDEHGIGPVAGKDFVGVVAPLAGGQGQRLGHQIGQQLLLAGGALDIHVSGVLGIPHTDELAGHHGGALMNELVEGVLAVGAGLAPDDRSGVVIHECAVAGDSLAVAFHVQLLQVGGEAHQGLAVWQDSQRGQSQKGAVP